MPNTSEWVVAWKLKDGTGAADPWVDAAVALGVGDGFLARTLTMPEGLPEGIEDFNIGQIAPGAEYWNNFNIEGQIGELACRYEGIEKWLAQVAGDDTAALIEDTAYSHTSVCQDTNVDHGGTLGIRKGVGNDYLFPGVRVTGFELKTVNGLIVVTPNIIANSITRASATTLDSVTTPQTKLAALFNSLTIAINDFADADFAGSDEVYVSDFTLSYDRRQVADAVNRLSGIRDEPESSGSAAEGTLRLVFPNEAAVNDVFHTDNIVVGPTEKHVYKARLTLLGIEIAGTTTPTYYQIEFDLPSLVVRNYERPGSGPLAKTPVTVELGMTKPESAPTGMSWVTDGQLWQSVVQNENATAQDSQ